MAGKDVRDPFAIELQLDLELLEEARQRGCSRIFAATVGAEPLSAVALAKIAIRSSAVAGRHLFGVLPVFVWV
jgi:hypothetical protein